VSTPDALGHPVVLFDGVCNFCSGTVNWIIARDPKAQFRFAALQSDAGRALQERFGLDPDALDTLVLVEKRRPYVKSTAFLRVVRRLGLPWRLLYPLVIVPRPVRDFLHDVFARRRYRWFGKKDECMVPTAEVRERFLD
jgi:predicted DCC family thiol-disulfide oxidoreductase YuxK